MSFTKAYLTQAGIQLCTKLVRDGELKLLSIKGGDGPKLTDDYSEQTQMSHAQIDIQCSKGIVYDENHPQRLTIPIYYENSTLSNAIQLTEIGLFAEDPDEGEILFCILPAYDHPLSLPSIGEGRLELTMDILLELSLAPEVSITLPPSLIFLTKPEADKFYAPKEHRHAASEIDESNGSTTEVWQRNQDAEIEALKIKTDAGTTMAETHQRGTEKQAHWMIVDNWGIYDAHKQIFYA